jgi:hypothetical protein
LATEDGNEATDLMMRRIGDDVAFHLDRKGDGGGVRSEHCSFYRGGRPDIGVGF